MVRVPITSIVQTQEIQNTQETQQPQPKTTPDPSTPSQVVDVSQKSDNLEYTPMQRGLMIASVIWGCVGTALFFSGRKKNAHI